MFRFFLLVILISGNNACPSKCSCLDKIKTVVCTGIRILDKLPDDTQTVIIKDSKLESLQNLSLLRDLKAVRIANSLYECAVVSQFIHFIENETLCIPTTTGLQSTSSSTTSVADFTISELNNTTGEYETSAQNNYALEISTPIGIIILLVCIAILIVVIIKKKFKKTRLTPPPPPPAIEDLDSTWETFEMERVYENITEQIYEQPV